MRIDLQYPSGSLVNALVDQAAAPRADVVVGLDEITGPQAIAAGVLAPYTSPALAGIDPALVDEVGGPGYVTPYEYGFLAIDSNASSGPSAAALANWSFPSVAANATLSSGLLIEDPTVDITGEEFLLWEVAFYRAVLHQDWTAFWRSADPHLRVAPDWSTAFGEFTTPPANPPMVVSYSTDPAYTAVNGGPAFLTTVGSWNHTAYAWRTTYGLAVVKGTSQSSLARSFVDWFLSPTVQAQLPLTEFEYPVNSTQPLPAAFDSATPPGSLTPLNSAIPPSDRVQEMRALLDTWQNLANSYGPG